MLELTKDNFDKEVRQRDSPVIVDFWAEWCGPCKQLAPVFEKVAEDYKDKLAFAKVDVQNNEELAADNQVMGLPCLVVYKNGQEVGRITGALPEAALKEKIDGVLAKT